MTDREKLIALLEEDACPLLMVFGENMGGLADHLLANGVTFATDNNVGGKWIPVTERLPEKHGESYLCWLTFPETNGAFSYILNWYAYGDNGYVNGAHFSDEGVGGMKVTHWTPLPEPSADMRKGENG